MVGVFEQALNRVSLVIPLQLKYNPGEFKALRWGDSLFQPSNPHSSSMVLYDQAQLKIPNGDIRK